MGVDVNYISRIITEDPDVISEIVDRYDMADPMFIARLINLDADAERRYKAEREKYYYDVERKGPTGAKYNADDDARRPFALPDEAKCTATLRHMGVKRSDIGHACNQNRLELMADADNDDELDWVTRCYDMLVKSGYSSAVAYKKCRRILYRVRSGGLSIEKVREKIDSPMGPRGFRIADKRQDAFDKLEDI